MMCEACKTLKIKCVASTNGITCEKCVGKGISYVKLNAQHHQRVDTICTTPPMLGERQSLQSNFTMSDTTKSSTEKVDKNKTGNAVPKNIPTHT